MKNKLLLIFLLFGITFSFGQTVIKMEKSGGVYIVPCKVNGLPLEFIFDTGASDVSISETEASFMLKNNYLTIDDLGESVYYRIANGDVAEGTKLNIREIEIGGLKLQNVTASIVHQSKAPLLLGQSVIEKLGKIQIDKNELTILKGTSFDYSKKIEPTSDFSKLGINSFVGNWTLNEVRLINFPDYPVNINVMDLAELRCFKNSKWVLKNNNKGYFQLVKSDDCNSSKEKILWTTQNGDILIKYDKKNNTFGYRAKIIDANYNNFSIAFTINFEGREMQIIYNLHRK